MLKNLIKLEVVIAEKAYQLLCDNDSPLEHLKEVLFQFQKYVGHIEDQVKAMQDKAKADAEAAAVENKVEEIKPE